MEINEQQTEPLIIKYLHSKGRFNKVSVSTTFELTSRCNFRCRMCYVCDGGCAENKQYELSAEDWLKVAKEAKEAGVLFLLLTGGEPLIRDDFCRIYEELSKMGFIISINTNGSLITDEHIELFKRFPPNRMNISLYGMSDEAYKSFCGVPAYTRVTENLKKLKEAGINFLINCALTPLNASEYSKINAFCKENNIVLRMTSYIFPSSRIDRCGERFSAEEAADFSVEIDKDKFSSETFTKKVLGIKNSLTAEKGAECPIDEKGSGITCRAGSSSSWINWKGQMSFCGMIPACEEADVLKTGFEKSWEKVMEMTKKIVLPAKCQTCKYEKMCTRCAASIYCETGKYDAVPEYICKMTECIAEKYKTLAKEMEKNENKQ